MAWRQTGDKPLPELMLTQFTDAYRVNETKHNKANYKYDHILWATLYTACPMEEYKTKNTFLFCFLKRRIESNEANDPSYKNVSKCMTSTIVS